MYATYAKFHKHFSYYSKNFHFSKVFKPKTPKYNIVLQKTEILKKYGGRGTDMTKPTANKCLPW